MHDSSVGIIAYRKSGNFRCKNIFVVDMVTMKINLTKISVHY